MKNFGVKTVLMLPEKMKKAIYDKYGVDNVSKLPYIRAKVENTMVKKFGKAFPLQNGILLEKYKNTNFIKYGYENPMQNADIAEKSSKNSFKIKKYTFESGNIINIQGYENITLDYLLKNNYSELDLLTNKKDQPEIFYIDKLGKYHRYYPDIFIKKDNIIIEVKSVYTYNMNIQTFHLKKKACQYLGYDFQSFIYTGKKERVFMYI
jgi:hypothetical protein